MPAALSDIVSLAKQLCQSAGLPVEDVRGEQPDPGTVRVNIASSHPALLIGRNGEALFALQHLLRLMLKKRDGADALHVVVDIENYRREQEENIVLIAQDIVSRVRETGLPYEFPPMLSYKRRAIHTFFAQSGYEDLAAYSVGEGQRRRVRIEVRGSTAAENDPALP